MKTIQIQCLYNDRVRTVPEYLLVDDRILWGRFLPTLMMMNDAKDSIVETGVAYEMLMEELHLSHDRLYPSTTN